MEDSQSIYLRTATSFLNAWSCSGVGSVTFKIFTATSPANDSYELSSYQRRRASFFFDAEYV